MKVSPHHQALHERAVELATEYKKKEIEIIAVLEEMQRQKSYLFFGAKNLFTYAHVSLKLSEPAAYVFSAVARRAADLPVLSRALNTGELSVYTASRILSVLCTQNATELIEFAKTHTQRELDFEVARRNPKRRKRSTAKPVTEDTVRLATDLKKSTHLKLKRAQVLMSKRRYVDFDVVLEKLVDEWLERHDPIIKADRTKTLNEDFCANRKSNVPAAAEHERNQRDRGQCTVIDENGERCTETWWTEAHHIKHRKNGGTNEAANLTTLCSYHHKMHHQYDMPLKKLSWMKEREAPYITSRKSRRLTEGGHLRQVQ